ncbi:MAG: hypothetical protein RLZ98_784 [Pseudomonadota bacterium]|jgi:broad specificity phosphatase PhoE
MRGYQRIVPAFLMSLLLANPAAATESLWEVLRSGKAVAMMRHAIAPGTGDPNNFRLGDCATQRNLSDEGRKQAQRIGARFRRAGIVQARVFTSQWCRCRDTASLLGLGPANELPALNSFYATPANEDRQTERLRNWLSKQPGDPLVLVTHQVNITALTGVYPRSGEIVVLRMSPEGKVAVLGRL